jgi:RNA polymerase sigma factor (sigma-70 family)
VPQPSPLAEVYEQHLASVWRYVRARVPDHADAEDATSEVFARAARGWHRYDPAKGAVGAWLAGIAHHVVADWWRQRSAEVPADEAAATPIQEDAAELVDERVDAAEVRKHLHLLTDRERDALALRFGADLSSTEVGDVLGISDAGARMLIHRAVAKLRGAMA